MAELVRFGVSMDSRLLARFDQLIDEKGYSNRSEAIRDLIRGELVEQSWEGEDEDTVGTITLVYNHEMRDLTEKLIDYQHQVHGAVISSLHVHLDKHNCLEVLVVRGTGREIKKMADGLIGTKGVKHGKLVTTTTGRDVF
ncbi:MAG: nickel-responsive transcriptional regulator NikR [Syntrophobacterales bacterium]|nr:MAG: nickel-responsive transcriptional regulator NikR [Syntrophobacterales bacterium]